MASLVEPQRQFAVVAGALGFRGSAIRDPGDGAGTRVMNVA